MMEDFEYELAGDYLAMAAYLAEIKSRILLPREEESEEQEGDPKAELLRRLQEYKRFKEVSFKLDEMPRIDRDIFPASGKLPEFELPKPKNNYDKNDLSNVLYFKNEVFNVPFDLLIGTDYLYKEDFRKRILPLQYFQNQLLFAQGELKINHRRTTLLLYRY